MVDEGMEIAARSAATDRQISYALWHYWWGAVVVGTAALTSRLWFWLFTDWTIEDALITARMARNLVEYGEFTFNVGERISSSTSPIFGLGVATLSALGFETIAAAKFLGLLASVATCFLIYRILTHYYSLPLAVAGSLVYCFFPPVIAYSVGGMETALYTLACAAALERILFRRAIQSLYWASFAVLLRPDGAILLFVLLAFVILTRSCKFSQLIRAWPAFVLPALFFILHYAYYDAFLPHSALAKMEIYSVQPWQNIARYLERMFLSQTGSAVFYFLALVGVVFAIKRESRFIVLVVWYVVYHLFFMLRAPLFSWYLQPPLFVLILLAVIGLFDLAQFLGKRLSLENWIPRLRLASTLGLCSIMLIATIPYANGRRANQHYERTVRASAGLWLFENSLQSALVFTESLGYVGYHTSNPFVDWPGLASPVVPQLLSGTDSGNNRDMAYQTIIEAFDPAYLVLRDHEWSSLSSQFSESYQVCGHFPAPNEFGPSYTIVGKSC